MTGEHPWTPRYDESERALIGSIIKDPSVLDQVGGLNPSIFFNPAHRTMYCHLVQVYSDYGTTDWTLLRQSFTDFELESIGGIDYLSDTYDIVPIGDNFPYYLEKVRDAFINRNVLQAVEKIQNQIYERASSDKVRKMIESALRETLIGAKPVPEKNLKTLVARKFESMRNGTIQKRCYQTSGVKAIDSVLGGVFPGELMVIASETSRGKTALAVQMATYMALGDQGLKVAIFSFEMGEEQIVERIISARATVRMSSIRYNECTDLDWKKLDAFESELTDERLIVIEDSFCLSVDGIRARCRELKSRGELHAVIVDYVQLVNPSGRSSNRQQEVAEVSRNLKLIAGNLDVLVIGLSQVNEAGQMRESRAIEQDADIILQIRDDDKSESTSEREILVKKNRNGPRNKRIKVDFFGEYVSFQDRS
jgi:replicative DNA helicase